VGSRHHNWIAEAFHANTVFAVATRREKNMPKLTAVVFLFVVLPVLMLASLVTVAASWAPDINIEMPKYFAPAQVLWQ